MTSEWRSTDGLVIPEKRVDIRPGVLAAVLVYAWLRERRTADRETRCRRCGHILRGITELRCPECGEQA